jgi:phosphatidylglycerol:prolipoprotein diacylglycerol transferase
MKFPNINPTAFEIFGFEIKWYGISYAVSLFLAYSYSKLLSKKYKIIKYNIFDDIFAWVTLGMLLGGRLGYVVFYNLSYYLENPYLILLGIRDGGMSFHGGIIGVTLSCLIFSKIKKIKFLDIMDIIACAAPIGLFLGRIANFINSELWGKETDIFFGVIFPNGGPNPRHPSQIYEAFLEGIVLFLLVNSMYKKKCKKSGYTCGIFLIFYSIFRIFIEFFREPDAHIGYLVEPNITIGIFLCLPMILLGIFLISYYDKNRKNYKR